MSLNLLVGRHSLISPPPLQLIDYIDFNPIIFIQSRPKLGHFNFCVPINGAHSYSSSISFTSIHIFRNEIFNRFATRQYKPSNWLHLLDSKLYFSKFLEQSRNEKSFLTPDQSRTSIWSICEELKRPEVYSWSLKWKVRKYNG